VHEDSQQGCGAVTREKLIEAAGVVFAEKGLHGARVRDITDLAGTNVAAVNYHFHDKFELYTVVLLQAHEVAAAAMARSLTAETPEGRIRQLLERLLAAALDPQRPKWHTALLARELLQPTPALDLVHQDLERPSHRLRDAVGEMLPGISEQQATLAANTIIGNLIFYIHHQHLIYRLFSSMTEPPLETIVNHVVDFSLSALRGLNKNA
jgi:AcrR family transcriptional regulator